MGGGYFLKIPILISVRGGRRWFTILWQVPGKPPTRWERSAEFIFPLTSACFATVTTSGETGTTHKPVKVYAPLLVRNEVISGFV